MSWRDEVSKDAVLMLDTLVNRKKQLDGLKAKLALHSFLTFVSVIIFAFLLYNETFGSEVSDPFIILERMIDNKFLLVILAVLLVCYFYTNRLAKEISDMKKKLEALRIETIEKFDTTWIKSISSNVRDEISSDFANQFGINIVYKN